MPATKVKRPAVQSKPVAQKLDHAPLTVSVRRTNTVMGSADPGATVLGIDRSQLQQPADAVVVAKADDRGKYLGHLPGMHEGDYVAVREQYKDGELGPWVSFQAHGLAKEDTNPAYVSGQELFKALFHMDGRSGEIHVGDTGAERERVTEPNALVQFENERTQEVIRVKADSEGRLPLGFTLKVNPGDKLLVAASDGVHNTDFSRHVKVVVPGASPGTGLADPKPDTKELGPGPEHIDAKRYTGPLVPPGFGYKDFDQGQTGDCYFAATLSGIEKSYPGLLAKMVQQNKDGTYTITFHKRSSESASGWKTVKVKVDADLYQSPSGGILYGHSGASWTPDPKKMPLLFAILEKGYAQFKGGTYNRIGHGGWMNWVLESVLGKPAEHIQIKARNQDQTWDRMHQEVAEGRPVLVGSNKNLLKKNPMPRMVAPHAYTVLGFDKKDGDKIILRNPWGEMEPHRDGKDDGIFRLTKKEFFSVYSDCCCLKKDV